jgi:hypothetical protein
MHAEPDPGFERKSAVLDAILANKLEKNEKRRHSVFYANAQLFSPFSVLYCVGISLYVGNFSRSKKMQWTFYCFAIKKGRIQIRNTK